MALIWSWGRGELEGSPCRGSGCENFGLHEVAASKRRIVGLSDRGWVHIVTGEIERGHLITALTTYEGSPPRVIRHLTPIRQRYARFANELKIVFELFASGFAKEEA